MNAIFAIYALHDKTMQETAIRCANKGMRIIIAIETTMKTRSRSRALFICCSLYKLRETTARDLLV